MHRASHRNVNWMSSVQGGNILCRLTVPPIVIWLQVGILQSWFAYYTSVEGRKQFSDISRLPDIYQPFRFSDIFDTYLMQHILQAWFSNNGGHDTEEQTYGRVWGFIEICIHPIRLSQISAADSLLIYIISGNKLSKSAQKCEQWLELCWKLWAGKSWQYLELLY